MEFKDLAFKVTLGDATCKSRYWAPVVQGPQQPDGKYVWLDDRRGLPSGGAALDSLPWLRSQPNGLHFQQCAEHRNGTGTDLRFLNDMSCSSRICSICNMPESQTYYLRGEIPRYIVTDL